MIRVLLQPEPVSFDDDVRQPGLSAIEELIGNEPLITRTGPKRKQLVDETGDPIMDPDLIPGHKFPDYWTRALTDLWEAYDKVCAFSCFHIPRVTGSRSVDHMIPKSMDWEQVYEWSNYRLACALVNSRKGASLEVLDPFEIEDGWFMLELTGYQLVPNPDLGDDMKEKIRTTIRVLGLNEPDCRKLREEYAESYWSGDISLRRLERHAPHVAFELERQGRLRDEPLSPKEDA